VSDDAQSVDGTEQSANEKGDRNEREAANIIGRVRGSGNVEKVDGYSNHDPFGIADVIAVGEGKPLFVQVKTNRFTAEDRRKYKNRTRRLDFDHARFEVWVRVDYEGWRMHRYDPGRDTFVEYVHMETCDHEETVEVFREAVGYYEGREVATDGGTDQQRAKSQHDGPIEPSDYEAVRSRQCEICDSRTKHVVRDGELVCTEDHTTPDNGQKTLTPDGGQVQDRPEQKTLDEDTEVDPNKVLGILRNVDRVDDTARPLAVVTMEKFLFDANDTDDLDYGTVRNAMEQTDGRLCLRYEDYVGHGYLALLEGELQRLMQLNRSGTYNGPYGSTTELVDDMLQDGEIRLVAREDTPFAEGGESA